MSDENVQNVINLIEKSIPQYMAQGKIPGLSIALVKDSKVVYAKGFGARNREDNVPATQETLYGIGSCSKSFTALSVMQLVEKGLLNLEDPVSKHVPLKIGMTGKPITIHHLLSHSSGIPALGSSTILRSALPIPMSSFGDHYRFLNGAQQEIAAEPGKRFAYLNEGYCTLQDIVQRTTKMRLDEYVTRNILKLLEMQRSTYSKEEFLGDPDRMTSYIKGGDGEPVQSEPVIHELLFGRGGLLCPVTELTNYLTMNINNGKFGDMELLSPELMEQMHSIQIETPRGWHGRQGYGYGWSVIEDFLGRKLVMHGGSISVSGGYLAFMPKEKAGVAMGYNMLGFPSALLVQGIFATLLGKGPEEAVPTLSIRRRLRNLVGSYETYRGVSKTKVSYKGGLLYFESVPLIPENKELETYDFYTYSDGTKNKVIFDVHTPEKIDMYVGGRRFHKVEGGSINQPIFL